MADHDNTRPRRRRLHLTDATAKRLAASGKPKIHYDADLRGFGLRTGGRAAWILAYSLNRVEHRVTIGTLAAWPAKAARIRAQELRQMVDRGQDPLQQRLDERAEKTERVKPVRAVRARSRRRWYPRHRRRTYDAALDALLREVFLEVFRVPRPPLAIGIHREILEVAGAEVSRQQLGWFLA
jgi:hypothetical protein